MPHTHQYYLYLFLQLIGLKEVKKLTISFGLIILIIFLLIIAYFGFVFAGGGFGKKPLILNKITNQNSLFLFAHRGIAAEFPENSRGAIEQAKIKGFKGLEVDIRKSSDNEFILFHDADCSRLLGIDSMINSLSTSQLKEHPLLFNNKQSGSYVITLKEMLDEYRDDFFIYFDMKLKSFNDIDELVYMIETYDISRSSVVASTSAAVVFYIEYHYPVINTALEGFNPGKEWMYFFMPKNLKPDFLSGFASKVNDKHIEWLKKKDLMGGRIVYGVDSTNYQALVDLGLKNMIIDYWPGLMW
jgi:glycerophosphoryl diester phosphodiesterase